MPSINFAVYPAGKAGSDPNDPHKLSGNLEIDCQVTGFQPIDSLQEEIRYFKERLRIFMRDNPRCTTFN